MPLQKRKASAGDEEGAANLNKRRRTVEETLASAREQSKFQDTDTLSDVVQSENECADTVSIDEKVTLLSKPTEIGDSSYDGQSSSSLNFQSVPVTSVNKPQQNQADVLASPAQTVPAFKSPSESAESRHDILKRHPDLDIELPANIVDQPDTTQTDGDHGLAKHVEDMEASLTKTADKPKTLPSVKAEIAKDSTFIAELSARTFTHFEISQLNDESKLTNQLNRKTSASASQAAPETDTTRPRSDSDQTDILRLNSATEFAKDECAELSETATQADITDLKGDRAPAANLETITPLTSKEVEMSEKAQVTDTSERAPADQVTIQYLTSKFEPAENAAKCSSVGSTLQKVSELDGSQQGCDLEHEDAIGDAAVHSAITEPQADKAQESFNSEPVTNDDIAESSSEAPSQQSYENESVSTETGPQFKYSLLYRLLRSDENPKENGIRAQCQRASYSIHKHVSEGSSFGTQYISTSASMSAMLAFASNKKRFPKKIAEIDIRKLEKQANVEFIDLTDQRNRENFLKDQRAKNLARKYEEVLITGEIPASCITTVDTYWRSDFDSDDSDEISSGFSGSDDDFDFY